LALPILVSLPFLVFPPTDNSIQIDHVIP